MELNHFATTPPKLSEENRLPFSDLHASQSVFGENALSQHASRHSLNAAFNSEPDHSSVMRSGFSSHRSMREAYNSMQSLPLRSEEAAVSSHKYHVDLNNSEVNLTGKPDQNADATILPLNSDRSSITPSTADLPQEQPEAQWRLALQRLVDHNAVVIFMTVVTIYALFFDDIRIIFFMKPTDDIFFGISTAALFFFTLELVIASIAKPQEYFLSFFFWLDLVSTLSLIPDIGWIWDNITNVQSADNATSLAKTSRAGRVTRVIRVIRLIRLIRIVKLYKQAKLAAQKKREAKEREELKRRQAIAEEEPSFFL